jgi:hypothetical protein
VRTFFDDDPNGPFFALGIVDAPNAGVVPVDPVMQPDPPMTSYLRFGTSRLVGVDEADTVQADHEADADPTTPGDPGPYRTWGDDLALLAIGPGGVVFADDNRVREPTSDSPPAPDVSPAPDARPIPVQLRPGTPAPPDAPPERGLGGDQLDTRAKRRAESQMLLTRGGWRDHTDGNRVTTTRGDKIEVIQGNYKLLVLGRQDPRQRGEVSGVDMSGGLVDSDSGDLGNPRGTPRVGPDNAWHGFQLNVEYTWHKDDASNSWYWRQTTRQGDPALADHGNGQIVSNTWVDYQETNLGSATRRVNQIVQNTFANRIIQNTDVNTVTQNTWANTVTESTTAESITQNTFAEVVTNNTGSPERRPVITTTNVAQSMHETDWVWDGNITLAQFAKMVVTYVDALAVDLHYLHEDLHLGLHADQHVGQHDELHLGGHMDLHIGAHMDVHVGGHLVFTNHKYSVNEEDMRVHGHKFEASQSSTSQTSGTSVSNARCHCIG